VHFDELLTRLRFLAFEKVPFLRLSADHQQEVNDHSQSHRYEPEVHVHQKVLLNADLQKLMQNLLTLLDANRAEDDLRIPVPCRTVLQRIEAVHDAGVFV